MLQYLSEGPFLESMTHDSAVICDKTLAELHDEEQLAFQRMRDLAKESQMDPMKRVAALQATKDWMNAHKAVVARKKGVEKN